MLKVYPSLVPSAQQVMFVTVEHTLTALQMAQQERNVLKAHFVRQDLTIFHHALLASTVRARVRQITKTARSVMQATTVPEKG